MSKLIELYGVSTQTIEEVDWLRTTALQSCPFLNRKCLKVRKSEPDITIGTCTVLYASEPILICPYRLLERRQIFMDGIHLLTLHEPGNELHIVSEVSLPGGSVDYFLVSTKNSKVIDFIGLELQTLDTTGTVWPVRQNFLQEKGLREAGETTNTNKSFGMNWKMTAKTTLVQLHHKVQTFEALNKHLVLVIQDRFLNYMQREFQFEHLSNVRLGDAMHFHTYNWTFAKIRLRPNVL